MDSIQQMERRNAVRSVSDLSALVDSISLGENSQQMQLKQKQLIEQNDEKYQKIRKIVQGMHSTDTQLVESSCRELRKLLSVERNPPIAEVVEAGVVPRLILILKENQYPAMQYEATWALTNIASGSTEFTDLCVNQGAIPPLLQLLQLPPSSKELWEQSLWAIGNIAGDGARLRDVVLNSGALSIILSLPTREPNLPLSFLRNYSWTLSNLCRGKPAPAWGLIAPAIPTIVQLAHLSDPETVTDSIWALSYLSDGDNSRIQHIIESGVVRRLVELMTSPTQPISIMVPCLRTIGNIVTGDERQTKFVIDIPGALPTIIKLLSHTKTGVRKEACWAVSNIAANESLIQYILNSNAAQIIMQQVAVLYNSDRDFIKEAVWVFSNITAGSKNDIEHMVKLGVVPMLVTLLNLKKLDRGTQQCIITTLKQIIEAGGFEAKDNQYVQHYKLHGVESALKTFQEANPQNSDCVIHQILEFIM